MSLRSSIHWLADPVTGQPGASWNLADGCTKPSEECINCLAPETRVLYADMTWRPIGDVQIGDVLIGFTEAPSLGMNRKVERTVVEAVRRTTSPTVELTVGDRVVVASGDHRWLATEPLWWRQTERLRLGMQLRGLGDPDQAPDVRSADYQAGYVAGVTAGDGTMRWSPEWRSASLGYPQSYWRVAVLADDRAILDRLMAYLAAVGVNVEVKPFNGGPSSVRPMLKVETRRRAHLEIISGILAERSGLEWQAGWLAGIFDTDGSYSAVGGARVAQKKANDVLACTERYAAALGFSFKAETSGASARLAGGMDIQTRFLSRICPALTRKCEAFHGRRLDGSTLEVNGIRRGPVRELVDIQTSTRTFIAEGVCTHNCYITRTPPLRMTGRKFSKAGVGGTTDVQLHPERLPMPIRVRLGMRWFVDSLGDLLHDEVPEWLIAQAFAVIAATQRHTYVVLTKRHARLRALLNSPRFAQLVYRAVEDLPNMPGKFRLAADDLAVALELTRPDGEDAPMRALPNVELGVSAGNQRTADLRIPHLLAVAGDWTRVVSLEPLIGPVDLTRLRPDLRRPGTVDALRGRSWVEVIGGTDVARLDGLFVGGESGPAAKATDLDTEPAPGIRSMDLAWARRVVAAAAAAEVPVHMKQLGSVWAKVVGAHDRKGGDPVEWPEDLRVRQYAQRKQPAREVV